MKQTGNYYYGARYFNPKWSTWLSVDPLAEKYPNISSYAYVAQNPIKYIDPNGKEIVYQGKNSKERRTFKRGLKKRLKKQFRKSKVFRQAWRTLNRSKKEYRIKLDTEGEMPSDALGQFQATDEINFNKGFPDFDEEMNVTNLDKIGNSPDRAGGDIFISPSVWDGDNKNLSDHVIVEEIIHAVQFDLSISLEEARSFSKMPIMTSGNREFEAKMIVGIINYQSGISLYSGTESGTTFAQEYGVQFEYRTGSRSDYLKNMLYWKNMDNNIYKNFPIQNSHPIILKE